MNLITFKYRNRFFGYTEKTVVTKMDVAMFFLSLSHLQTKVNPKTATIIFSKKLDDGEIASYNLFLEAGYEK